MNTETVGADLQDTLVELIELSLQAKQLHWNLTGRLFLPLHEQLDSLADEARDAADAVAERAITIGCPPDGRTATVAERSPLATLPSGTVADHTVVDLVVVALTTISAALTERVARLGDPDPVTQDLLIGVQAGLDKQRWMFHAQQS